MILTNGIVRTSLDYQEVAPGTGNRFTSGSAASFTIDNTFTDPINAGLTLQNVVLTVDFPDGMYIADSTTVVPISTDSMNVEFYDGATWSTEFPASDQATAVRWVYGQETTGSNPPQISFDAVVPIFATTGTEYKVEAVISSPSDNSTLSLRRDTVIIEAERNSTVTGNLSAANDRVAENTPFTLTLDIDNQSATPSNTLDVIMLVPANGDTLGSVFEGTIDSISVANLPAGVEIYVNTQSNTRLDTLDGSWDGYADPGTTGSTYYVAPGTGEWTYTLNDVITGAAGAPAISSVNGLRFVQTGAVTPIIPANGSISWDVTLYPDDNADIVGTNKYVHQYAARVDAATLALPILSAQAEVQVIRPQIVMQTEVMQDTSGNNISLTDNADWGEDLNILGPAEVYFRVKVINSGQTDLTGITVTDFIPENTRYIANSASASSGNYPSFPTDWQINLAQGDSAMLRFAVTSGALGSYGTSPVATVTDSETGEELTATRYGYYTITEDTDGDGVFDFADVDDDNDGILDNLEDPNAGPFVVPSTTTTHSTGGTLVTEIYTDYNGYWYSAVGNLNPRRADASNHLMAFTAGGTTYSTGVADDNMIDTNADGLFEQIDTDGNGAGDLNVTQAEFKALAFANTITNEAHGQGNSSDGDPNSRKGHVVIPNL